MSKQIYLIDAYNVIGSWPHLSFLKLANRLPEARDLLLKILSDFQDYNHLDMLVVFDAMYVPTPEQRKHYHNLKVVWTKRDQTADSYIEAYVHKHKSIFLQPVVVTSDNAEQQTIMQAGGLRMPDSELLKEVKGTQFNIQHEVNHYKNQSFVKKTPWNSKQIHNLAKLRNQLAQPKLKVISKHQMRQKMIKKLKRHPVINPIVYTKLFNLPQWKSAKTIATTMNTSIEINTEPIIELAWLEHKKVVVPIVYRHYRMHFFYLYPDSKLTRDKYGIREPKWRKFCPAKRIDLMVVPGLAFNLKSRNRLGFGGGYYDRYLKHYHNYTVALAQKEQCFTQPAWHVDKNDVKIKRIIHE